MNCIFAGATALVLALTVSHAAAEPSVGQLAKFGKWWLTEGGPALQRTLGHKGFRAARPAVPFTIHNGTSRPVTFSVESRSCDWNHFTFQPGEWGEVDCPTTRGDNWYNVRFDNTTYGIDGATYQVFKINRAGNLDLFNYTERAKSEAQRHRRAQRR